MSPAPGSAPINSEGCDMNQQRKNSKTSASKIPSISFSEILLSTAYVLAVALISESWLDTGIGAIAFAIASKINPYLSEFSIAFAQNSSYFIHCHVLATLILAPGLLLSLVARNGGFRSYEIYYTQSLEKQPLILRWFALSFMFLLLNGMLWMADYPFSKFERGVWVNPIGVAFYAFAVGWLLSVLGVGSFFLLKATFKNFRNGR